MIRYLLLPAISLLFASCAHYEKLPAGTIRDIAASPVVEKTEVAVTPLPVEVPPSLDYIIGPNDVLFINISGRPEFALAGGSNAGSKIQGSRVDGGGNVSLPLIGPVKVEGLTLAQAQARIAAALGKFLNDPWVVVEVAEYKSKPVYLLGQFRNSGTFYLDRPLNLVQGIALGNGFDPAANLRGARLSREGKTVPVDIYELLMNGEVSQNVWLKPGDTIFIPDNRNQLIFIFGAVKKPGPVPIPAGGLNLAQAIASAELRETGYDFTKVRIIRSLSPTKGQLMIVDYEKILSGKALPMQLMEGDIVYVPKSAFGEWNDVITDILPSLQAVSSILQPFVQVKFLTNK
jgi:polysaccharide biosynthesis/export protein